MNELKKLLSILDPGRDDPEYWRGFHARVMARARARLAARREAMSVDVSSLIRAWSRTLVPAALVAAAVAGLWLAAENGPPGERSVTVEEYLPEAAGGIPAVFLSGEAPDATEVLAVSEAY